MTAAIVRAGVWLACLLIPAVVEAFECDEHRVLTNAAFLAARHSIPDTAMSQEMRDKVDERLGGPVTFGDITLAVDWITNPEHLLDPDTVNAKIARRSRNFVM